MSAKYDLIGKDYGDLRKPDPRIAAVIDRALGPAATVLNVGAGTGSYEPAGRFVTAADPSQEMLRKRKASAAPSVLARAEALPFADNAFDASMAILTVHHWTDKAAGFREMRRVTRGRIVVLTFDPSCRPWLTDYLPSLATLDEDQMPAMSEYEGWLGPVAISPVAIPHDCSDGFLHAYWRRPAAYLDSHIRSGISSFWIIGNADEGLLKLRHDLDNGEWVSRYGKLFACDTYEAGYRLVVTT